LTNLVSSYWPSGTPNRRLAPTIRFCRYFVNSAAVRCFRADELYRKSKEWIGQTADLALMWLPEEETFGSQSSERDDHVELGGLAEDIQHASIRENTNVRFVAHIFDRQ
jgi:hypothetical protein